MDENSKKEEFSYAYIKMIAAIAGVDVSFSNRPSDNAGIDLTFKVTHAIDNLYTVSIDAQVKCVSSATIYDSYIKYVLKVKNYKR
ncbi:DUF4365 domain-containing protein [Nostoc sp. LEGE 12450]|uniref:DUF4365 domain-containing protein n=1 Tax=Nostoc sp. LEGE 12450 TaxID=1828643 RepID=UPI001882F194|nr:DUF4365 domain-containing protein [Nostoc sp. LEGE 12450]MBE8989440.1 DUF4365 domain-containing protein [Nostoc sp. LEGE 12450]